MLTTSAPTARLDDRVHSKLSMSISDPRQLKDIKLLLNGRDFEALDYSNDKLSETAAKRVLDYKSDKLLLVKMPASDKADSIFILVEPGSSLKKISKLYDKAARTEARINYRKSYCSDSALAVQDLRKIPADTAEKFALDAQIASKMPEKVFMVLDALVLADYFGSVDKIRKWAGQSTAAQVFDRPELKNAYSGKDLANLVEAAASIVIEAEQLAREKRQQTIDGILSTIKGPHGKWFIGAGMAAGFAALIASSQTSDPTSYGNEKKLAQLVEKVGFQASDLAGKAVNVELATYGNGQIANVRIISAEQGTFKGSPSYTFNMVLETELGSTFFQAKLTAESQGRFTDGGYLSISDTEGVNSKNLLVCSEAANLAIKQLIIGNAESR